MDNLGALVTLGTQETRQINDRGRSIDNGQSRGTGNIGHIEHETNKR